MSTLRVYLTLNHLSLIIIVIGGERTTFFWASVPFEVESSMRKNCNYITIGPEFELREETCS